MNLIPEIVSRRSIRKYKDVDISDEAIKEIVEAARLAPSGSNKQPWRFLVIRDREKRKKIVQVDHDQQWMLTAPVIIACLADLTCRIPDPTVEVNQWTPAYELKQILRDSAIGAAYLMLQAERMGLGTCWTAWYGQADMQQALGVPSYMYVTGVLTVGVPDEVPEARPRVNLDEILHFEQW